MLPIALRVTALLSLIYVSAGCIYLAMPIEVAPTPFDLMEGRIEQTPKGGILVRPFIDHRSAYHRDFIGLKRDRFGNPLLRQPLAEGSSLPELMTQYFADALKEAGYRAVIDESSVSERPDSFRPVATLEGGIERFWFEIIGGGLAHIAEVSISLLNEEDEVIWEGLIEAENSIFWLGFTAEIERAIRLTMDKAMSQAIVEFSSDEFAAQFQISVLGTVAETTGAAIAPEIQSPINKADETRWRWVRKAKTLPQIRARVGGPPENCFPSRPDFILCGWDPSTRSPTLYDPRFLWVEPPRSVFVLVCELPSDGSDRQPGSCREWRRKRVSFPLALRRGRRILGFTTAGIVKDPPSSESRATTARTFLDKARTMRSLSFVLGEPPYVCLRRSALHQRCRWFLGRESVGYHLVAATIQTRSDVVLSCPFRYDGTPLEPGSCQAWEK